jgi:hypothetical protein
VFVELTPLAAFAAGALVVSALGLAFVLGRRMPAAPIPPHQTTSGAPRSLEQVRRAPPVRYEELPIDRGAAL